jgi:hypothetical protein
MGWLGGQFRVRRCAGWRCLKPILRIGAALSYWRGARCPRCYAPQRGGVAQLVRALPCHGRGRGFESRRSRHCNNVRTPALRIRVGVPFAGVPGCGRWGPLAPGAGASRSGRVGRRPPGRWPRRRACARRPPVRVGEAHRRCLRLWSVLGCLGSGVLTLGCGSSSASYHVQRPRHPMYADCGRRFPHFDARRLLGLTEQAAESEAMRHECQLRPVERNGHALPVTDDYSSARIDVAVEARHVVRLKFVG